MAQVLSLMEFMQQFPSEDECFQYLVGKRWPDGFRCSKCGHTEAYFISKYKRYQCTACRHQTSVTAGTLFHKLRHPLTTLFWAVYLIDLHLQERDVRHGTATEAWFQILPDSMDAVTENTVGYGFLAVISTNRSGGSG